MGKQLCDMHRSRRRARIVTAALLSAFAAAAAALTVYLVFRPLKPQASVVRVAVYRMATAAGNSSDGRAPPPYTLAASARFTALLHNPSDRAVVFYDGLFAYVTYRGEMVAPPAPLPGVAQGRGAVAAFRPWRRGARAGVGRRGASAGGRLRGGPRGATPRRHGPGQVHERAIQDRMARAIPALRCHRRPLGGRHRGRRRSRGRATARVPQVLRRRLS